MSETTTLLISQIRLDGATQPRAELNYEVIEEYSQAMRAGATFPPVDVFYDGTDYWLTDGFHRVKAAGAAELDRIAATVYQGTLEQAQWHSLHANHGHGLRRTNADKQRAVQTALVNKISVGLSDREIALHVGVHHEMVSTWRKKLAGETGGIRQIKEEIAKPSQPRITSHRSDSAPARTYHPDRSQVSHSDAMSPASEDEAPLVGIEGALNLITAARTISRVRLGERDYDYLSVDIPGLRLLQDAVEILAKTLLKAQKFVEGDAEPEEIGVIQ